MFNSLPMLTTSISSLFESAQFLSFFVLLVIGFAYLMFSFVASEVGDFFGGGDGPDISPEGHDTISIFSPTVYAIFLVGFGAIGSIATHYGLGVMGSSAYAVAAGAAMGGLAYMATKALHKQQSNSEISPVSAINQIATVAVDIPPQGLGEVNVSVNGQYMTYSARGFSRTATDTLRRGQGVRVVGTQGSVLLVQETTVI